MPDHPGEWWFTGTMQVPHSPTNAVTVHIAQPRRFLVVATQFGLIPCDPDAYYPYALCTWDGWWESALPKPKIGVRIPAALTAWMEPQP